MCIGVCECVCTGMCLCVCICTGCVCVCLYERETLPCTLPSTLDTSSPVQLDELSFGYQRKAQARTP